MQEIRGYDRFRVTEGYVCWKGVLSKVNICPKHSVKSGQKILQSILNLLDIYSHISKLCTATSQINKGNRRSVMVY